MKLIKYAQSTMNREFKEIRKMKDTRIYKDNLEESYLIKNPLTNKDEIITLTIINNNVVVAQIYDEHSNLTIKYELH